MSEQQQNSISDSEEEGNACVIDDLASDVKDTDIRKNLFEDFEVPAKQKASSDSSNSGREYVKVHLRIRPFSNEEIDAKENQQCLEKENESAVLLNAPKESFAFKNSVRAGGEISHRFSFSSVFDETTTQKKFFDQTTLPLVADFIHGQNCLVFTYGVTNSGKTYTIQGTPRDGGILPRALDVVFNSIEGKHYSKLNLKPRFCTDVIRLSDEEEQRENAFRNALLSSLDKDTFDINALLKLDQDLSAEVSKVSCADESVLCNTMSKSQGGDNQDLTSLDAEENVSRVVDDTTINVDAQGPVKFSVWVSFAEIYNETIHDLLEPCPMGKGKKRTTLRLGDDSNGNPYIKGLREIYVSNADEAYKILKIGQKNLKIASTKLNQVTTRVNKPVDIPPPPVKKTRPLVPTPRSRGVRLSVPWANGAICTPAPEEDVIVLEGEEEDDGAEVEVLEDRRDTESLYQQQLVDLVKVLQEKLIEEKRKMQTLEVRIREEVCKEMAEQLVSIENAYSERVKMEVTAVEEKCDRRIELLTQSIKKNRKRTRIERAEEDDEEWVPKMFLHTEQNKVKEKQHIINDLNAKIAELRQEVKQLKDSRMEEAADSDVVLELQSHLNAANEEANELKEMLEEAGEAFTEKEAEISKLRAALDKQEACFKTQDEALKHLTKELSTAKSTATQRLENAGEIEKLKAALEVAKGKLADAENNLENKESLMKELVRSLEETRDELARERSYVAQAFDNDEELIRIKDELQKAEVKTADLEKDLASKDQVITSLKQMVEIAKDEGKEITSQDEQAKKDEVEELMKQLEKAKEEVREAKDEVVKTKSEFAGKDLLLEEVKRERDERAFELGSVEKELSEKKVDLEDNEKKIAELQTELRCLKEENEKRGLELKKAREENLEYFFANMRKGTIKAGKNNEIEISSEKSLRVKELEKEIDAKSNELGKLTCEYNGKIGELEAELTQCRTEIEKFRKEDAIKELEGQLEESTKALDKKNSQVIARNNTIKKLELSLTEKEERLKEMEKMSNESNLRAEEELKTLRRRLDQEREDSTEIMAKKDRDLEEVREQLEQLRRETEEKECKNMEELQKSEKTKGELELNLTEAHSLLEKRNEEFELKIKEVMKLREVIKTAEQEKFQELDKCYQEMMNMQKTIQERNKSVDELEQKLRDSELEKQKAEELTGTLKIELQPLRGQVVSLKDRLQAVTKDLELVTSDSEGEKEALSNMKQVLDEQDAVMANQAQEIEERQNEIESLCTELQTWQEKCSFAEKELDRRKTEISSLKEQTMTTSEENKRLEKLSEEIEKMKEARASLESQLKRKEEELRKANDSRDNIMKTMREALEVAKANKAEYDVKLATVRQQCREEMRREMDEEMRRTKRDFQKQLDDKDRSLEEAKCVEKTKPVSKTSESSKSSSSSSDPDTEENGATNTLQSRQKRPLKRRSSDLPLAEVRVKMLSAKKGNIVDSDEDFTPGRPRTRNSTRKAARSCSNRSKRTAVTGVDILPTMGENESKIDSRAEKSFHPLSNNYGSKRLNENHSVFIT
ncbi:PREDICTED: kinesin-like protein KIF20B [Acropora digitifera]|uniref:kinesin-like protein KIF20B n=1 Tax=Acropora digitifera TaxID=70779 RepID=UPI00077A75A2|nr:PREDICTED: kinesin-like protein KIF20B [Acropora digitifera]